MKLSLRLLSLISTFAICSLAYAAVPYVGAEAQIRSATLSGPAKHSFSKHSPVINVYGGAKFDNCLGFEFGGNLGNASKGNQKTKLRAVHASLTGYYPLDIAKDVSLVGGVGLTHHRNKYQHPLYELKMSKLSPRLMGGTEVELTESINWRTTITSENPIKLKVQDHYISPSFGVATGLSASF